MGSVYCTYLPQHWPFQIISHARASPARLPVAIRNAGNKFSKLVFPIRRRQYISVLQQEEVQYSILYTVLNTAVDIQNNYTSSSIPVVARSVSICSIKMTRSVFITILVAIVFTSTSAFVAHGGALRTPTSTNLNMVFGPKQAMAIEKRKNPQAFESTIQGLMRTMKLSRADAEKVSLMNQ